MRWTDEFNKRPSLHPGRKLLKLLYQIFGLASGALAMFALAYYFRLTATDKDFRPQDFFPRLIHDARSLQDVNTQLAIKRKLHEFRHSLLGK